MTALGFRDRHVLGRTLKRAMKDERESTEFWKVELFSFDVETLGKTDGLSVMLFFGLWEACVSFKKVSEGTS